MGEHAQSGAVAAAAGGRPGCPSRLSRTRTERLEREGRRGDEESKNEGESNRDGKAQTPSRGFA